MMKLRYLSLALMCGTLIACQEPSSATGTKAQPEFCSALTQNMTNLSYNSSLDDLTRIQDQLKDCLASAEQNQKLQWLNDYHTMYGRFLSVDDSTTEMPELERSSYIELSSLNGVDFDSAYTAFSAIAEGKPADDNIVKQLSERTQYLIKNLQKSHIKLIDVGEGIFQFRYDNDFAVQLFAPNLQPEHAEFIQLMAKQNQQPMWVDAGLTRSLAELIDLALAWESYQKRYPNGYFAQDVTELLKAYQTMIFFGADNSRWVNDDITQFATAEDEQAMKKLAQQQDSMFASQAQTFLDFMQTSEEQRNVLYPIANQATEDEESQDWERLWEQLRLALKIEPTNDDAEQGIEDCFQGIVCEKATI